MSTVVIIPAPLTPLPDARDFSGYLGGITPGIPQVLFICRERFTATSGERFLVSELTLCDPAASKYCGGWWG